MSDTIFNLGSIGELKILSNKATYILETNLNSLSDQFRLIQIGKNYKKSSKILFKNKKNKNDFRIKPTGNNAKKFSNWILKEKKQRPNFFDAQRVHLIISKMMISTRKKHDFARKTKNFRSKTCIFLYKILIQYNIPYCFFPK